jgi:hypothetical protein
MRSRCSGVSRLASSIFCCASMSPSLLGRLTAFRPIDGDVAVDFAFMALSYMETRRPSPLKTMTMVETPQPCWRFARRATCSPSPHMSLKDFQYICFTISGFFFCLLRQLSREPLSPAWLEPKSLPAADGHSLDLHVWNYPSAFHGLPNGDKDRDAPHSHTYGARYVSRTA